MVPGSPLEGFSIGSGCHCPKAAPLDSVSARDSAQNTDPDLYCTNKAFISRRVAEVDEKNANSIHLILNISENSAALVTKRNGREVGFSAWSFTRLQRRQPISSLKVSAQRS